MYEELKKEELGFIDLASRVGNIFFSNLWPLLKAALITVFPVSVVTSIILALSFNDIAVNLDVYTTQQLLSRVDSLGNLSTLIGLVNLFVSILFNVAAIHYIYMWIKGEAVTITKALKFALDNWISAFLTLIIFIVFIFGLALLLIFPALIFMVYWMFTMQAVVIEGKTGIQALEHSRSIVANRWTKGFLYIIGLGLMGLLITLPFTTVTQLLIGNSFDTLAGLADLTPVTLFVSSILQSIASLLITILGFVAGTVLYINWKNNLQQNTLK